MPRHRQEVISLEEEEVESPCGSNGRRVRLRQLPRPLMPICELTKNFTAAAEAALESEYAAKETSKQSIQNDIAMTCFSHI